MDEGRQADLRQLRKRQATKRTEKKIMPMDTGTKDKHGKRVIELAEVEIYNPKTDAFAKDRAAQAEAKILAEQSDNSETGKKLRSLRQKMIQASKVAAAAPAGSDAAKRALKAEKDFANQIRILQKQETIE